MRGFAPRRGDRPLELFRQFGVQSPEAAAERDHRRSRLEHASRGGIGIINPISESGCGFCHTTNRATEAAPTGAHLYLGQARGVAFDAQREGAITARRREYYRRICHP